MGDGETIAYLQDILVHPRAQRTGLGRLLLAEAFEPFEHVRQKVLLTDDEPRQQAFYEATGFTEIRDAPYPMRCFINFS
ncbi:MAG: GNAT family N-acetyltransferase [Propionibacteriaceae bacterium]|nr:GNAT family N-acetyltransferase [Propionibacteriaceae bacterium]